MNNYKIVCDSACDLSPKMLNERNVPYACLTYRFDGEKGEYSAHDLETEVFYEKMRGGLVAKTSGANVHDFILIFETILNDGNDILYLGFSSALSTTFSSAKTAADELKSKYPKSEIKLVDTLCASAGIALLLDLVLEKQKEGASLEEAARYAEETKHIICHWFTVDDLEYLKRGGRISPASAFFGNMLGIKPVLHVDEGGHLVNCLKVRGRRTAISTMADKFNELANDKKYVYISHASCKADAELLKKILKDKYDVETRLITNVGAVIGAHAGPGTLALFFVGKER